MAGTVIWHELWTSDVEAAAKFYADLLDAEIDVADMGNYEYPMLKKGERNHAGFAVKDSEHEHAPAHWYPYFEAGDVDAAVGAAQSGGAQLYHGPASVEGTPIRFAVLGDPQQATFGVLTSDDDAPTGLFVWDELHSTDTAASKSFYGELFGWSAAEAMENYEIFSAGEKQVGGLYAKDDDAPTSYWLSYVGVDDVDAAHAKAGELGAVEVIAPADIEGMGRFSVIRDPTGAAIGLYKSAN